MYNEDLINKIIVQLHLIAPEIKNTDEEIKTYINLYADFVSEKYFGKFYDKALAFFIAHYISLDNISSENGAFDSSIIAGNVISEKEGDLEKTYANSKNESDNLLNKTYYGIRYLDLQKMCKPLGLLRKLP